MPDTLMDAVLAMDVYNRYDNRGLEVDFNTIGDYTFRPVNLPPGSGDISFSGAVYTSGTGSTVISYRGTDNWNLDLQGDPINGFPIAIGIPFGAQFFAAFRLYQEAVNTVSIGGVAIDSALISFTGHSLGGGLAGLVAAIYGKQASLFANMPFELAVTNAYQAMLDAEPSSEGYADDARALIYGGSQPWQPSIAGLHAYAVDFEAIEFYLGRSQSTPEVSLDPGTMDAFKLTPIERHSMPLHTVLVWEKENHAAVDGWQEIAAHLWDSFNSNAIAAEVGFDTLAGTSTSGDKMAMGIAYSVVSEGERPFGDSAVQAFFDDGRDLGKAIGHGSNELMSTSVVQELSNVLVRYSGLLAKNAVLGEADSAAVNGVLTLNGQGASLSVDLQDSKWTIGGVLHKPEGRGQIIEDVADQISSKAELTEALQWYQQASNSNRSGYDLVGSITFALQAGDFGAIDAPSGQLDVLVTVRGSNAIVRGNSDDMLIGSDGGESLWGGEGTDILFGGGGGDELRGNEGANYLFGGAGDDVITSAGASDVILGGVENDLVKASGAAAEIHFASGDGKDLVETGDGDYQLVLDGLSADDVTFIAGGTDFIPTNGHPVYFQADLNILVVRIKSSGDQISFIKQSNVDALFDGVKARDGVALVSNSAMFGDTIDQDGPYEYRLDQSSVHNSPLTSIKFADGSVWSANEIWSKIANYKNDPDVSFDVLKPSGPNYRGGLLPSNESIAARMDKLSPSLNSLSTNSSDQGGFYDPVAYIDYLNNTYFENAPLPYPTGQNFVGTSDPEYFDDGYGDDMLSGGLGEDGYRLGFGDDTIVWNIGDGDDRVEGTGSYFGNDVLALGEGITPSDLRFTVTDDGTSLVISSENFAGSITLVEQVGALVDRGAFSISFRDGTVWTHADILAAAADVIAASHQIVEGTSGDDTLGSGWGYQPFITNFTAQGREGDDVIDVRGDGGGTIVFGKGDGHDTLRADSATAYRDDIRSDILSLTDILSSEVSFKRAGNALIITVTSTADAFIVQNQFVGEGPGGSEGVNQIVFGNSVTWTRSDILAAVSDGDGDDNLVGGINADWLFGGDGNDVLTGGGGDDTLDGGSDDDVYRFSIGGGQDRIREDNGIGAGGDDAIEFAAGIDVSDVVVSQERDGSDLVLGIAGSGDSVRIERAITDINARIEAVHFADGTVWSFADLMARTTSGTAGDDRIYGSELADTLSGGGGEDWLFGRDGDDIYRFEVGHGFDNIFEDSFGNQSGNDAIEFGAGIAANGVTVRQGSGGYDLILTVPGSGQITILNAIDYSEARVEGVRFADGTAWSFADMMARSHVATAGNDKFYGHELADMLSGGSGNDVLIGRDGDDVLTGGTGNDTLDGGGDSDIYRFARGDGQDVIQEHELDRQGNTNGEDTIEFAVGISAADVTVSQADDGTDLVLQIAGSTDRIVIDGGVEYGYGDEVADFGRVEKVQFADGTVWSFADMMARTTVSTNGDDTIYGSGLAESLSGGAGDDRLIGRYGDDVLAGGTGNDTLDGGVGNDTYRFGRGDGQDVVIEDFYEDIDTLEFSAGVAADDVIVLQPDSGGSIVFLIAGTSDQITVNDMNLEGGWAPNIEAVRFADGTVWSFTDVMARATTPTTGNDIIYGSYLSETLFGGDGNDVVSGRDGNDVIVGGAGNDRLSGDWGNDIYRFARGDGQDVIQEDSTAWSSGGGDDTVELATGIAPGDINVTLSSDGQSLILSIAGTSDSVELLNTVSPGTNRVEQIRFSDGTIWSHADLMARIAAPANDPTIPYPETTNIVPYDPDAMIGTAANDYAVAPSAEAGGYNGTAITGLGGDDRLINESWNGSIDGGGGNDVLEVRNAALSATGGTGNDYFLFDVGNFVGASWALDSQTTWATITDFEDGSDKIAILDTVAEFADLTLTQAGSDVEVTMSGAPKIVVNNSLVSDLTADDFVVRLGGDAGAPPAGGEVPYPDTTNTVAYNGAEMDGTAVNDSIFALSADNGGANGTALLGRDGDDLLVSESWASFLSGGAGNDVLEVRNDNALSIGGAGYDYFVFDPATFVGESWALDPEFLWSTIIGFTPGEDKIVLGSGSYEDLDIAQVDGNVEISMQGAPRIILQGASVSDIDVSDFLFTGSGTGQLAATTSIPAGTASRAMVTRPAKLWEDPRFEIMPWDSFDQEIPADVSIYRSAALPSQSTASFGQTAAEDFSQNALAGQWESDFWQAYYTAHSMRYSAFEVAA